MSKLPGLAPSLALVGAALSVALLYTFETDDKKPVQTGYRGTGMVQMVRTSVTATDAAANVVPEAQPKADKTGKKASEVYQNVQVLKDLDEGEFNRLMAAITEWVSPDQGCAYCHGDSGNFAEDKLYTKIVSRRMIQMTQSINANYTAHVQQTGVTCYTCHRGLPVPNNIWFQDPGGNGKYTRTTGRNSPSAAVGLTSLPYDPFTPYLAQDNSIRVASTQALPNPDANNASIQRTEWTYGLMMHLSTSLGVNCTFCHNTRSFSAWEASSSQRVTAWHGIRMTQALNKSYLEPLTGVFPAHRLGEAGDVAKLNCATCHQGVNKPLLGISMVKDYPELKVSTEPAPALAPLPPPPATPPNLAPVPR